MDRKLGEAVLRDYGAYLTNHGFEEYAEPDTQLGEDGAYFRSLRYCLRFYRDFRDPPPTYAYVEGAILGTREGGDWYPIAHVLALLHAAEYLPGNPPAGELAAAMESENESIECFFSVEADGRALRDEYLLWVEQAFLRGVRANQAQERAKAEALALARASRRPWWRFWQQRADR
jgi:hypothetical protein